MLLTSPLNILIVEDNPGDQFLVTELLKSSDIKIKSLFYAGTITESLTLLKKEAIDIVLLDLSLPDSYGIDSYNSIKKQSPTTPVVILSGFTDMNMALEAITQGAQDYLIKGDFDEKLLTKTILYSIERMNSLQEITEAVISTQENERREIGRELHDNINQILVSARLYLGLIKGYSDENSFSKKADNLISKAIIEIRSLSHALIPPLFNKSNLLEALNQIFATINKTTGLTVYKEFTGFKENAYSDKFKLTIYRIVQEQMNNIQKYARATTIQVRLIQKNKKVTLSIKDNGVGFNTEKKTDGVGLMNIKTRAALFNGEVNIISSLGKGCELIVIFNL